jgi:hypothetical protein
MNRSVVKRTASTLHPVVYPFKSDPTSIYIHAVYTVYMIIVYTDIYSVYIYSINIYVYVYTGYISIFLYASHHLILSP